MAYDGVFDKATPWPPFMTETYLIQGVGGGLFLTYPTPFILHSQQLHSPLYPTHSTYSTWLISTTPTTTASTPPPSRPEGSTRIRTRARRSSLTLKRRTVKCTLIQPISGVQKGGQDLWSGRRPAFGRQIASVSIAQIISPIDV